MNGGQKFLILQARAKRGKRVGSPSTSTLRRSRIFTAAVACILLSAVVAIAYQQLPGFRHFIDEIFSSTSEAIKSDYTLQKAAVILSRGNALRAKGQYKEAGHAYQASLEKFSLKKDNLGLGNIHTEMGILSTQTKDYESAREQFQQALRYFVLLEDSNGQGYATASLAQLHYVQGDFFSSEQYFLIAEQHYKESGNQEGLGNVALGLGNLYTARNQFLKATWFFKQAEPLFKQAKNNRGLVTTYNALGRAFLNIGTKQGDEESRRYYQLAKTIELNTDSKDLPEELSIRDNLKWLASAFNQHKDIYEGELNTKAKEETERALR